MIPLFKTRIYSESVENVKRVLESGWLGLGPKVEEFENKISTYLDTPFCIATNSGTSALQLAIELANLPKGSIVISTPLTFVSTNHVILQAGLNVAFADIDLLTGNISTKSIERILQDTYFRSNVSAIMVVHYGGQPVPLDPLYDLATEYNLKVIEDCAHAMGAEYKNHKIGCKFTNLGAFSTHAVKNLTTGDGGFLVTNNGLIAERARKLRWLGIDKSTSDRSEGGYSWEYECESLGFKCHMNDIQAAIGLGQLLHLDEDNLRREQIVERYKSNLNIKVPEFVMPLTTLVDTKSSNHLMVVLALTPQLKFEIMNSLEKEGIQTGCHYKPNYYYPVYYHIYKENNCKSTESFYRRAISLPNHLYLENIDIDQICEIIVDTTKEYI